MNKAQSLLILQAMAVGAFSHLSYILYNKFSIFSIEKCMLAAPLGLEPRLPPSEGYNGFRDRCSAIELRGYRALRLIRYNIRINPIFI